MRGWLALPGSAWLPGSDPSQCLALPGGLSLPGCLALAGSTWLPGRPLWLCLALGRLGNTGFAPYCLTFQKISIVNYATSALDALETHRKMYMCFSKCLKHIIKRDIEIVNFNTSQLKSQVESPNVDASHLKSTVLDPRRESTVTKA